MNHQSDPSLPRAESDSLDTASEPGLNHVELTICDACLDGVGDECHTPGCALWMSRAPDIPIRDKIDQQLAQRAKFFEDSASRYHSALGRLMAFGESLMASDDEDERGIGCCICEGARAVRDA